MKFSEITSGQWEELSPYLDTCLLPLTGMSGVEKPFEATEKLERLRDIMDLIEIPFKGRVVTYPAWHYISGRQPFKELLQDWCVSAKNGGFRFVIAVTADPAIHSDIPGIDLWVKPDEGGALPSQAEVSAVIREMWSRQST
ncbi:YpiF family protein [Paenibacillus sp. N4]|uniref:DUF2487 family protein n=1 Tax=Paenibacillus vietnamensis TaxID=2590547 RepID=UPI001CD13271|nr:DUF2487 family protein [Paenibacillus vietnamensis]MCA0754394.1 YpiF family protein [Paenibacillus vietnamensis]